MCFNHIFRTENYLGVNGCLPEKLRHELIWNRKVNYSCGVERNLLMDLMNELLNRLFKGMNRLFLCCFNNSNIQVSSSSSLPFVRPTDYFCIGFKLINSLSLLVFITVALYGNISIGHVTNQLKEAYGRYTDSTLDQCSQLVGPLAEATDIVFGAKMAENFLYLHCRRSKHRTTNAADLAQQLFQEDLFSVFSGRQHQSFPEYAFYPDICNPQGFASKMKNFLKVGQTA